MTCNTKTTLEMGGIGHTDAEIKELMDVNKLWKEQYDLLQKKHEHEKLQLQEDNIKLKQEVRRTELRCSKLESKNLTLQSELVRLARSFEALHPVQCGHATDKQTNKEVADVELIREQLDVYKEDFKLEHKDKEKIQSEKASLEEKLLQYEKLIHSLNKQLDLYKSECQRLQEDKGKSALLQRHPSIDRSHSYPSTTTFPSRSDTPVPNVAMAPALEGKRDGYLSLQDFRHEQLKRGILARNPPQVRSPPGTQHRILRRLSDSSSSSGSTDQHLPSNSSRTSCLW